jgi:hypothetical protein
MGQYQAVKRERSRKEGGSSQLAQKVDLAIQGSQ